MEYFEKVYEVVFAPVNATQSLFNGSNTIFNIAIPIALIAIAVGMLAILLHVSSSIEKYRRFKKILKLLSKSFSYCAYGMLTVVVVGMPVVVGWQVLNMAKANPEGTFEIVKWAGLILGSFVGFAIVGYVTKNRIWKKIWKYHKEEKSQDLYKEQMKELPIGD